MKYSLLVPCYNAENYIESFLENISGLTRPFDEILFYDDASTDNTYQILKLKGCNVIRGTVNKGPGYARNQLVQHSSGDWFHFHDVDDGLDPEYLTKIALIAELNTYDVILCNVDWLDAHTKQIILKWHYSNAGINKNPLEYAINNPIGGINGLYRRSVFMKTGGFNTQIRIWEDADMHVRLAHKNAAFYVVEEVLSYALRYPLSASTNQHTIWLTRAALLWDYYTTFKNAAERSAIGKQAQKAASNLVILAEFDEAKKALQLSELCSVKVPDNDTIMWRTFKQLVPRYFRIRFRMIQLKLAFSRGTASDIH